MTQPVDPLDLITLGPCEDVDPGFLEEPGMEWGDVVEGVAHDVIGPGLMEAVPRSGWRPLATSGRDGVLAAPTEGGWALLFIDRSEQGVHLSGDPGPYRVRPGRSRRREGLQLVWPDGVTCSGAELSRQQVLLVNRLDRTWVADPEDRSYAYGLLFDERGQSLNGGYVAYSPLQFAPLADLEPGAALALAVEFGPAAADLPAGQYGVEVVLSCLELRGARGSVTLVHP